MSLSPHDEAVLRSCAARLAESEPGLAEIARFFEQVFGTEPMPRHERIRGWRPQRRGGLLAWMTGVIALAALAAGRVAWRTACGVARALVRAVTWYSESLGAAEAVGHSDQRQAGREREAGHQG